MEYGREHQRLVHALRAACVPVALQRRLDSIAGAWMPWWRVAWLLVVRPRQWRATLRLRAEYREKLALEHEVAAMRATRVGLQQRVARVVEAAARLEVCAYGHGMCSLNDGEHRDHVRAASRWP